MIKIRTYRNIRKIRNEFRIGPFDKTSAIACGLTFLALLPILIILVANNKGILAAVILIIIELPIYVVTRYEVPEDTLPFGVGTKIYKVILRYVTAKLTKKKVLYTNMIENKKVKGGK